MTKTVALTRIETVVGSAPKDTWEAKDCTPVEAVEMAMKLLDGCIRNLIEIDAQQLIQQGRLLAGLSQTIPGVKEYIEVATGKEGILQ